MPVPNIQPKAYVVFVDGHVMDHVYSLPVSALTLDAQGLPAAIENIPLASVCENLALTRDMVSVFQAIEGKK